jgi:predicted HicB family RNase H-like nuclease
MALSAPIDEEVRVSLQLRVPRELRRRAKADAGRHDRSMNDHIVTILDEHLPAAEAP